MTAAAEFRKTAKQQEQLSLVRDHMHCMAYGGSRSAKTFGWVYAVMVRAMLKPSRHLIVRKHFNHAKTTIWYDTLPKVSRLAFGGVPYKTNKSDWFIELPNGSEVWIGGIDDKDRVEKILGHEYSTVFANECSQLSYDAISALVTRLAEKSGLGMRFLYDCNPPSKKHWSYRLFVEGVDPIDGSPLKNPQNYAALKMNPNDNRENIAEGYIENVLMGLPARQRQRFLDGNFLSDVEGALWSIDMVIQARARLSRGKNRTVIGVDPSVSGNRHSDLCGIVVASQDSGGAIVEADYSMQASPNVWAQCVVNAYHKHKANCIVAESNQGGEMVRQIIHNIDRDVVVKLVHARHGKYSRAEPVSALYEQGRITHADGLDELETEMMEYVPMTATHSPDRMDAMVYALTELLIGQHRDIVFRVA